MLDSKTKFAILGLGVLGGSYAEGLSAEGFEVIGIDIDTAAVSYAEDHGWITKGGDDPALVKEADIVISCLYPHVFIDWVKKNKSLMREKTLLCDVTGVKRAIISSINSELAGRVEFIATHPMAGRESRGILYASAAKFENANYLIVPTEINSEKAVQTARQIGAILGFGSIKIVTPEEHDRMIGFLSQLAHIIAVSLMNACDNTDMAAFSGDSFRDLTRIANINESLWPELFILNKDYLLEEIDAFTKQVGQFRRMIEDEDEEGMREKMIIATRRRKAFEKK